MKIWKSGILFLVAFLVQGSLLNLISIKGVTPNLLLAFTVVLAYIYEDNPSAMIYGAVFGLLYDVCFMQAIGQTGIMLALIAFIVYLVDRIAERTSVISFVITSIATFVLYNIGQWVFLRVAGNPTTFFFMLKRIPSSLLYTLICEVIIYLIIRYIEKLKRKKRKAYNG